MLNEESREGKSVSSGRRMIWAWTFRARLWSFLDPIKIRINSKIFDQAEKILLAQDAVIVPLYCEPQLALVSKRSKKYKHTRCS